jgi:Flp pilus assembly protein TadD
MGSYSKAAEDFKKAIKLSPTDAGNYNSLGWAMYNLKQYNEALKYFNIALDMKLNEPYIFYNIGLTELSLNNTKNACKAFKTAVEKGHIEAKNYYNSNCIEAY